MNNFRGVHDLATIVNYARKRFMTSAPRLLNGGLDFFVGDEGGDGEAGVVLDRVVVVEGEGEQPRRNFPFDHRFLQFFSEKRFFHLSLTVWRNKLECSARTSFFKSLIFWRKAGEQCDQIGRNFALWATLGYFLLDKFLPRPADLLLL